MVRPEHQAGDKCSDDADLDIVSSNEGQLDDGRILETEVGHENYGRDGKLSE